MGLEDLKKMFPFPASEPDVPLSDHGWFGLENEELLKAALGPHTKVVLELGSWLGKSTRFIAQAAPNAALIALDHWLGSAEHKINPTLRPMLPILHETFLKNCWALRDRLIPLRANTVPGMKLVHGHGILPDLVYVDAAHDYQSVRADIMTALELFPDALLCGDDFQWPGVAQAVRERVSEGAMTALVKGNAWWRAAVAFGVVKGVLVEK